MSRGSSRSARRRWSSGCPPRSPRSTGSPRRPVKSATDIGAALRLASALFPDDAQKRIVLLSDGNDTTGAGQSEAALAASRGVQIETRRIGLGDAEEVLVERLTTPSTARLGEAIRPSPTSARPSPSPRRSASSPTGRRSRRSRSSSRPGSTPVTFDVKPTEAGFHTFRAVVEAARDTFSQNDRADSNTIVKGEPRTLVLAGDETVAAELVAALETQRQQVDTMVPEALPTDFAGLAAYDSIVLVDVPRLRLYDRQLAALQVYVRDLGKGLVMIGGPKSYGAGGYQKTPLEETLPVDMGVRDREKQPDIALVVVIDKSGSMDACHCNTFDGGSGGGGSGIAGVRKVDIGKEAILRAAAAMTERDELGVVAFNEAAHWVVQTQPLGGIGDLQGPIAGIQPDGQTNIFAGPRPGGEVARGGDRDAAPHHPADRRLVDLGPVRRDPRQMKADGITLSTVGAGGGANPFLEQLAKQGGGRFYAATNPASIPDIFLKETQQVSGQQIVEEPFFPIQTSSSPILRGLDAGLPQLLGYNGTTAKAAAQTVLVTARDDPLLAQWQYGLGRSVAWTSDSTGRWAKDWVGWNGFSRFFSQLVSAGRSPARRPAGSRRRSRRPAATTALHVESVEADGSPRDFYATTRWSSGRTSSRRRWTSRRSRPASTRRRSARSSPAPTPCGSPRRGRGRRRSGGRWGWSPRPRPSTACSARTSRSSRRCGPATGGAVVATAARPVDARPDGDDRFTDLWPLLLVLALLLWPLDIALRRVSIGRRELAAARGWVRGIGRRRGAAAADGATARACSRRATGRGSSGRGRRCGRRRAAAASSEPRGCDRRQRSAHRHGAAPGRRLSPPRRREPPNRPPPDRRTRRRRPRHRLPRRPPTTRWPGCATRKRRARTAAAVAARDHSPARGAEPPVVASARCPPPAARASCFVLFAALAVAACGCSRGPPAPTPADFPGIAGYTAAGHHGRARRLGRRRLR